MRATILFAFLALTACKRVTPDPAQGTPMPAKSTGVVQIHEGHALAIVKLEKTTVAIPLDRIPPGTLFLQEGRMVPLERIDQLGLGAGGGICPCCVRTCGSPCQPGDMAVMPCEPFPPFDQWPGKPWRSGDPSPL